MVSHAEEGLNAVALAAVALSLPFPLPLLPFTRLAFRGLVLPWSALLLSCWQIVPSTLLRSACSYLPRLTSATGSYRGVEDFAPICLLAWSLPLL